eukprot:1181566-Prorocentrum_minimum.AAC.2
MSCDGFARCVDATRAESASPALRVLSPLPTVESQEWRRQHDTHLMSMFAVARSAASGPLRMKNPSSSAVGRPSHSCVGLRTARNLVSLGQLLRVDSRCKPRHIKTCADEIKSRKHARSINANVDR